MAEKSEQKTESMLCICKWRLVESGSQYGRYREPNTKCPVHFPKQGSK